jgi:hexosaminidase
MKRFLSLILAISASTLLNAQTPAALRSETLPLIPYPNHIVVGTQDLKCGTTIVVNILSDSIADDAFAVSTLADDYSKGIKWEVKEKGNFAKSGIIVARVGKNRNIDRIISDAGLTPDTTNNESYALLVDDNRVIIEARTSTGIFYGLQTLRQLGYRNADGSLSYRSVKIADTPALRYRWIQDDWSRGPIPTVEFVKQQIRTLAEYKINGYCIYGETIFQSHQFPGINLYGGTITQEEEKEIAEYGRKYHVDIIPQQECLGHMHYAVRDGLLSNLGERRNGQVLSPAVEGTYDFLQKYLNEIVPQFSSDFVHIGCDEAFELGLGKSADLVKKQGVDNVFFNHLRRVSELPALKGKKLLFWGEISEKAGVDLTKIPKTLIPVVWDYLPRTSYDYSMAPYDKAGIRTIVAPGTFWGGRVFPSYNAHLINIRSMLRDGKKYHTLGMLNATWDDMGEDLFNVGWYGILYGACCSWQQEQDTPFEPFKKAFDWAFYRNGNNHMFSEGIDTLSTVHTSLGTDIWYDWAYSVPFDDSGVGQQNTIQKSGKMEMLHTSCAEAFKLFSQGRDNALLHRSTIDALLFGARRMNFVFAKAEMAADLSRRYDDFCKDDDKGRPVNTAVYDMIMPYASKIGSLRDLTKELKTWHHDLWMQENRPFHWDVVEARYEYMLQTWNREDAILRSAFGTKAPREQVGMKFDRP